MTTLAPHSADTHANEQDLLAQGIYSAQADYAIPRELWGMPNPDHATPVQIELFTTDKMAFHTVERLVKALPRQRQREYFRKLYLRTYKSVKDDGSIAYACGNKQRYAANKLLHEVLTKRLTQVFQQYRVNLAYLQAFKDTPSWVFDIEEECKYAHKWQTFAAENHTVPTRYTLDVLDSASQEFTDQQRGQYGAFCQRQKNRAALPFYLISENQLKLMAQDLADEMQARQRDFMQQRADDYAAQGVEVGVDEINASFVALYHACGLAADTIGFPFAYWDKFSEIHTALSSPRCGTRSRGEPPQAEGGNKPRAKKIKHYQMEKIDADLLRAIEPKYWFKQMKTLQKRMQEHIRIACGEVRKQANSYVSLTAFLQWQDQCRRNWDFIKSMIIENVDDPEEQRNLMDMYLGSSSNPTHRRHEMMCRLRGLEEWAEDNDYEALFLTLTAPSSYHAALEAGGVNPKWNGAHPKQTQTYLSKVWAQYRAQLNKREIKLFGMRVAEPHHDATPHWHLLVYVKKHDKQTVIDLFRKKALEQDGDERGAKKHRFRVEECDKAKGSATAYIAKYISKNIDGFANDGERSDENPELTLKENSRRVRAWASWWGIRQFQFFGGSSISVWREVRRLTEMSVQELDDEILTKAFAAADQGKFRDFLDVQGGAIAKREEQPIKLDYEESEPNQYGITRQKIKGVTNKLTLKSLISRLKKWTIKRKPSEPREDTNNAGAACPWTCVSNCNLSDREKLTQTIQDLVKPYRLPLNERQIAQFLRYGKLILNGWQRLEMQNNRPILISEDKPLFAFQASSVDSGKIFEKKVGKLLRN